MNYIMEQFCIYGIGLAAGIIIARYYFKDMDKKKKKK